MASSDRRVGLIVAADEPALYFSSIAAAEDYLEAIDVVGGVYGGAYGPGGEVYDIGVRNGRAVIRLNGEGSRPDALRALLLRAPPNQTQARDGEPLASLIKRCADFITT